MMERFKDTCHPLFKSISALRSWNSEKEEQQRHHTLQCGCFKPRVLLFRIVHSVKELSIRGAVSNGCEQFGLAKNENGQAKFLGKGDSVTKGVLTSVISYEVNFLVSSPRLASGSSLPENIQDFGSLSKTIRFTRLCEDAMFVHRVSAGMSYKTRLHEDDGFGQIIPFPE